MKTITLTKNEFRHLLRMLEDSADVLEAFSEHEEFSWEIRQTIKKLKKEHNDVEMTYSDELYLESKGEK